MKDPWDKVFDVVSAENHRLYRKKSKKKLTRLEERRLRKTSKLMDLILKDYKP